MMAGPCKPHPAGGPPLSGRAEPSPAVPLSLPTPEAAGRAVAVKSKAASRSQRFPSPRPSLAAPCAASLRTGPGSGSGCRASPAGGKVCRAGPGCCRSIPCGSSSQYPIRNYCC
ncbi:unnamed protein product [Lepidochelys kempii]